MIFSAVGGRKAFLTPWVRIRSKGRLGAELPEPAGNKRHTVIERGHHHVDQPADPGPVRGRPEAIAGLRQDIVAHLDARQMADQGRLRQERALRRPGGARGIDQDRRVGGGGVFRLEMAASARHQRIECQIAARPDGDDPLQRRKVGAQARQQARALRIRDHQPRAGILQPVAQGIGAEELEERQRAGAKLLNGDMGGGGLRALREQNADPVARPRHAGHAIRHPVGQRFQLSPRPAPDRATFGRIDDRDGLRIARGRHIADRAPDVEPVRHLPAKGRAHLLDCGPGLQHQRPSLILPQIPRG